MAAEPAPPPGPGVFVTVGTTEFDALVAAATAPPFLARLEALGFAWLRLQVGRGAAPHLPAASTVNNTHVSWFRFTRDLPGEMARAHIVVSHAGAGSILEALELKRRLVVVPNSALMDDDQAELAGALAADRHLVAAPGPAGLCDALAAAASGDGFAPLGEVDAAAFPRLVDDEMRRPGRCVIL